MWPWHGSVCKYHQTCNIKTIGRGGGPLVISHKCQVNLLVNLGTKASYAHSSSNLAPGTIDKTSHCAKFHISSCLISWLPKTDLCETTECSPPLQTLPRKITEPSFFAPQNHGDFVLCPAKLWSNADFAPQNRGDIVPGAKKYYQIELSSLFF